MAELFKRLTEDIAYVQKLGDNPNSDNSMTASMLKAWFDKAALAIQLYLNSSFIPQIEAKFGSVDAWIAVANEKIENFVIGAGFLPVDGSLAMSGTLDLAGNRAVKVADPVDDTDAVNKAYADAIGSKADDANTAAKNAQETADKKCRKFALTLTLAVSGWSGGYQVVSAPGVLADMDKCDVLTSPTEASREMYNDCVVRCTGQGDNTLTFMCNDVPDEDLSVGALVLI